LVSYVPARNKAVILLSSRIMTTRAWVRKKIANLKTSCKILSQEMGFDVQDKLVRE
jgi:hypothetical protein